MKGYLEFLNEGKSMIGYKVMPIKNGVIGSGANGKLKLDVKKGKTISMPGNGIYMSLNQQYVLDYYAGLADEEVLVTFEFNPSDITTGNTTDKETEISVKKAKVLNVQPLDEDGELNESVGIIQGSGSTSSNVGKADDYMIRDAIFHVLFDGDKYSYGHDEDGEDYQGPDFDADDYRDGIINDSKKIASSKKESLKFFTKHFDLISKGSDYYFVPKDGNYHKDDYLIRGGKTVKDKKHFKNVLDGFLSDIK